MKKSVAIGIFPDRLDLLVVQGGRVAASRRLAVALEASADGWALSLRKAGPMLCDAVRELKVTGWSAVVLYSNPTCSAEYVSLKASSMAEACAAAVLSSSESLGYPLALAVTAAAAIARDADAKDGQTHTLVAADRDDHATAIADLVQEAGLKLATSTPIDAAIMMKVATEALLADTPRTATLYVGENRSYFVIVENGTLVFARPIGLGMNTLAVSLTRPIRSTHQLEPVELDLPTAHEMLRKFGFPDRKQVVHEGLGITGAQIIPLLQPVLQRFIVELRQSIRFGVSEDHRQSLSISLKGPGCAIPGFAGIVGGELRLDVKPEERPAETDMQTPGAPGSEMAEALADSGVLSRLNLQPNELARARQISKLQRWMWSGAALGLLMVGVETFMTHNQLTVLQQQMDAMSAQASEAQSLQASSQKMLDAIAAMTKLEHRIANEVGAQVNIRACMQELAAIMPPSVRLTEIRFTHADNKTSGSVLGYAFAEASDPRKTELESFIARLKDSPLFDRVALGNVQVATVSSKPAQQFEVTLSGVSVPVDVGVNMHLGETQATAAAALPAVGGVQP